MKWYVIGAVVIIAIFGGVLWFSKNSAPKPGTFYPSAGRDHVAVGERVQYKTNPPTSGNHYADWTRPGVYETAKFQDEYLVHSLEHGYVNIWYNCDVGNAKGDEQSAKSGTESAQLEGDAWKSEECMTLKKQLGDLAKEQKLWKLIVIPRQNMETRIALTAWTRLDTMDTFDKDRIVAFIKAYRNNGPEQTVE